jgi:hypothetical protein
VDLSRLRPLRVGEVLDVAINIYRQRFGDLARAVAVVVIPISLLSALVTLSVGSASDLTTTQTTDTGFGTTTTTTTFDSSAAWAFGAGFLLITIVSAIATELATAASFDIVSGTYLDREPTWSDSLRFAASRVRSLIWLQLVYVVLLMLATLACVIPGIYFYVAWALAVPALLFEDVRGRKALKRSRELLKGRWWPTAGVLVLVFILNGIVSFGLRGVFTGLLRASDSELVDAIGTAVASAGASVLTTPFAAAVTAVLYYDALVRKEGFDLQQMAEGFGVDSPDTDQPPWSSPPG